MILTGLVARQTTMGQLLVNPDLNWQQRQNDQKTREIYTATCAVLLW